MRKKKQQTQAERDAILGRELERVHREEARQKRTGKKRSIPWVLVNTDTGEVTPPPGVLRVVE